MNYLGIDPGQSGGIAVLGANGAHEAWPMPKTERDVWMLLDENIGGPISVLDDFALIEAVHSFPGQGVASSFKFGMSYGGLRMALTAAGIPFEEITPQQWQRALGIKPRQRKKGESKTQFKNRLKAKAQQLFPDVKMTLAICDALLIAEVCRRMRT